MDEALIAWRAVHFMATAQVAGVVIFRMIVSRGLQSPVLVDRRLKVLFWLSLAIAVSSGAGWALSLARAIDGTSWVVALQDETAKSVLVDTQFGKAWIIRSVAAVALAVTALFPTGRIQGLLQLLLSAILVGGLAFAGHGASSPGIGGDVHLAADILHLIAVAAWVGSLLPYAVSLPAGGRANAPGALDAARRVTLRYSNLATAAVLTILATGVVNTLNLVGSLTAFTSSEYGRLLSLKLVVFAVMLAFAAINRFVLMPRFSAMDVGALKRNALIELALGAVALSLVAAFGTMPPPLLDAGMAAALNNSSAHRVA